MDDRLALIYGEIYKLSDTICKVKVAKDDDEFGYDVINADTLNVIATDCSGAEIYHEFVLIVGKKRYIMNNDGSVYIEPKNYEVINITDETVIFEDLKYFPAMYKFGRATECLVIGKHLEDREAQLYKVYNKKNGKLIKQYKRLIKIVTSDTEKELEESTAVAEIEYIADNEIYVKDAILEKSSSELKILSYKENSKYVLMSELKI